MSEPVRALSAFGWENSVRIVSVIYELTAGALLPSLEEKKASSWQTGLWVQASEDHLTTAPLLWFMTLSGSFLRPSTTSQLERQANISQAVEHNNSYVTLKGLNVSLYVVPMTFFSNIIF